MKIFSKVACLVFSVYAIGGIAQKHPDVDTQHEQSEMTCCHAVELTPEDENVVNRTTRGLPSRPPKEDTSDFIVKGEYLYVLRLAVCIENSTYRKEFKSSKEEVHKYWKELEEYLNTIYRRDCGIEFEIVKDDKLILQHNVFSGTREYTKTIDKCIGNDKYDLGIVIISAFEQGSGGNAVGGGVASNALKGEAVSSMYGHVIAHELGHMFGAKHTQETRFDATISEQGIGQSIMSYGRPRNSFSLVSVRQIRQTAASLPWYDYDTDRNRTTLHNADKENANANAIYRKKYQSSKPIIDVNAIKQEYVVTKGTCYQFYIPTTRKIDSVFYNAQQYDYARFGASSHLIQRYYDPVEDGVVMFHKRYGAPKWNNGKYSVDEWLYSNDYKIGEFTYYLSAFKDGQHDVVRTRLRIIDGEPFQITEVKGLDKTIIPCVTPVSIKWKTPSIYEGKKVRILLSDDFGKTFKYVLADNEANDGEWTGVLPYVDITERVTYPSYAFINNLKGGRIKLEVIGEAAYDITHKDAPYTITNNTFSYTGGFEIDKAKSGIVFDDAPDVYLELPKGSSLPAASVLKAHYNGQTQSVRGQDTDMGDGVTYRTWTFDIGGTKITYRQVIKILSETKNVRTSVTAQTEAIQELAHELYEKIGVLGYPKADITQARKFKECYILVFDSNGKVKAGATEQQATALRQALLELCEIDDDGIVMPKENHTYKIASVHQGYANKETRYYLAPDGDSDEKLSLNENEAIVWIYKRLENGAYEFVNSDKPTHVLYLKNVRDGENGIKLVRGFRWGAMGVIGATDNPRIAEVHRLPSLQIKTNTNYYQDPIGYRINSPDKTVSTDFLFIPTDNSPTSIKQQTMEISPSEEIYDLTGRRVLHPISGGLYVKDGKKFLQP